MKKIIKTISCLLATPVLLCSCGQSEVLEMKNDVAVTEDIAKGQTFPTEYKSESESGKVIFDVTLDIPENVKNAEIKIYNVNGRQAIAIEQSKDYFVGDRTIINEETYSYEDMDMELKLYQMDDGTDMSYDDSFCYASANSGYYSRIQINNSDYLGLIDGSRVDFATDEECKDKMKEALHTLGYEAEQFDYYAIPLNHTDLAKLEEQSLKDVLIEEKDKKGSWTAEDDAYVIYAYQKCNDVPVFYEMMSGAKLWATYTIDNAPIIAVYSTRGLEKLNTSFVYHFSETGESVTLKPMEEIAAKVEAKYENLLNDVIYTVDKARLFYMVEEGNQCTTIPIWHFEITGSDGSTEITVIDAVTGDEIYIQ